MTRTLLIEMGVPHYLWSDALLTSAYLLNRLPSSPLGCEVPLCRLHPDRVFVGYSRTQKGYRVYLPDQRKYLVSADITFFETTRYFSTTSSTPTSPPPLSTLTPPSTFLPPTSPSVAATPPLLLDFPLETVSSFATPPRLEPPAPSVFTPAPDSVEPPGGSSPTSASSAPLASAVHDLHLPVDLQKGTRSCTLHPISHNVNYDRLRPTYRAFSLSLTSESIPRSHLEALSIPHWKEAMDQEYAALTKRRTWILVSRLRNMNIVTCRWIFTVNYKPDGTVDRYKARLVARGFT
ncbi:uncharacterized protein LOC144704941 [Wolffia australiana]